MLRNFTDCIVSRDPSHLTLQFFHNLVLSTNGTGLLLRQNIYWKQKSSPILYSIFAGYQFQDHLGTSCRPPLPCSKLSEHKTQETRHGSFSNETLRAKIKELIYNIVVITSSLTFS